MIIGLLKRIFSAGNNELQFEKDLVSLSSKIRAATNYRTSLKCNQKRYSLLLVLYLSLAVACSVVYLLVVSPSVKGFAVLGAAIAGGVLLWKAVGFYYSKRIGIYEAWLADLKRQQKAKVEEFKLQSGYYKAKSLIERFDQGEQEERAKEVQVAGIGSESVMESAVGSGHIAQGYTFQAPNNEYSGSIHAQNTLPTSPVPSPMDMQLTPSNFPIAFPSPLTSPGANAYTRGWMDKVVDAVLGETPAHYKYALVCSECYTHNGLCFPEELPSKKFICTNCSHLNDPNAVTPIAEPEEHKEHEERVETRSITRNRSKKQVSKEKQS